MRYVGLVDDVIDGETRIGLFSQGVVRALRALEPRDLEAALRTLSVPRIALGGRGWCPEGTSLVPGQWAYVDLDGAGDDAVALSHHAHCEAHLGRGSRVWVTVPEKGACPDVAWLRHVFGG